MSTSLLRRKDLMTRGETSAAWTEPEVCAHVHALLNENASTTTHSSQSTLPSPQKSNRKPDLTINVNVSQWLYIVPEHVD